MKRASGQRHGSVIWVALGAAALLLAACWKAGAQTGVTLEGTVRTNEGRTVHGTVTLTLTNDSGLSVGQQFADSDGGYSFEGLHGGVYVLTVSATGFAPFRETIDLTISAPNHYADVYLTPAASRAQNPANAPSRTDQEAPKKARKEELKGSKALARHKYILAQSQLMKAVKVYPCYARAQTSLAVAEAHNHNLKGAEASLRQAVKCDPDFLESYLVLGEVLDAENKHSDAALSLQQGIRRAPSSWRLYYQLAVTDLEMGRLADAGASLKKVKFFDPSPPSEYYVKLADLCFMERDFSKAYAAMQGYLRVAPHGRYVAKINSIIQQLIAKGLLRPPQSTGSTALPPHP